VRACCLLMRHFLAVVASSRYAIQTGEASDVLCFKAAVAPEQAEAASAANHLLRSWLLRACVGMAVQEGPSQRAMEAALLFAERRHAFLLYPGECRLLDHSKLRIGVVYFPSNDAVIVVVLLSRILNLRTPSQYQAVLCGSASRVNVKAGSPSSSSLLLVAAYINCTQRRW